MNPIKEDVGKRIKAIRENGNYSMESFGKLINDSAKGTVNNWEKGKRLPKEDALEKIAILGNTTPDKILYGELYEYVFNLVRQNLHIELNDTMIGMILLLAAPHKLSYNDDVQWLEVVQKIFAISKIEEYLPAELLYIPISGSLYIGQVRNQSAIEQSKVTDDFNSIYYAFADVETNILHVIAFLFNENKEELFFQGINFVEEKGKHNYFTNNFPQIGLKLENSRIVSYGISRVDFSQNIQVFSYDQEDNCFFRESELKVELFPIFEQELKKEVLQLKAKPD